MRLPTYYQDPRFHCSVAYDCIEGYNDNTSKDIDDIDSPSNTTPFIHSNDDNDNNNGIPSLTKEEESLLQRLNDELGQQLRRESIEADEISVKIGKTVNVYTII